MHHVDQACLHTSLLHDLGKAHPQLICFSPDGAHGHLALDLLSSFHQDKLGPGLALRVKQPDSGLNLLAALESLTAAVLA